MLAVRKSNALQPTVLIRHALRCRILWLQRVRAAVCIGLSPDNMSIEYTDLQLSRLFAGEVARIERVTAAGAPIVNLQNESFTLGNHFLT